MRHVASISAHIAGFLDFCRIEKGLSKATLEAYHLDLERFARSLGAGGNLEDPASLRGHIDSLHAAGMNSRSIARHITTIRNLYGFLLEKGAVTTDPTLLLTAPTHWQSLPKYLNTQQIERLIAAPNVAKPQGLRDRAMLEFLYATGLRVSELCKVGVSGLEINMGVVRVLGKGNKHRIVPVGKAALKAVEIYLASGRPQLLKGRPSPYLS